MINLMPTETKKQIRAARINVILVRYIVVLGCAFAFLLLVAGVAHVILDGTKAQAQSIIDANQTRTTTVTEAQAQATALSTSLTTSKQILDSGVSYSKLLTSIGALVPQNVIIDKLTLSPASFGTPFTIQIFAKSSADASTALKNFSSSPIFSNVTMPSISQSGGRTDYPTTATLNVTLNRTAL